MVEKVDNCFGCGCCSAVCPKFAIKIELNEYGFWYPKVNENLCIQCQNCLKVCPSENPLNLRKIDSSVEICAAMEKEKDAETSSGGISNAISKYSLSKGEFVCGVRYNYQKDISEHIVCQDTESIGEIKGSKYLASYTADAFEEMISVGHGVCFGTPCQIAGLNLLLKRKGLRDNFLLIDIFCHGVPSQLLWKNYLESIRKKKHHSTNSVIRFRKKGKFIIKCGDYERNAQVDSFYYFYLRGLVNRESCYNCPFRRAMASDLRIGDYFDNNHDSWSIVIFGSQKGKQLIKNIEDRIIKREALYMIVDKTQDADISKEIPNNRENILIKLKEGLSPNIILGKRKTVLQYVKWAIKKIFKISRN